MQRSHAWLLLGSWLAAACGDPEAPPVELDPSSRRHLPQGEIVGSTGAYGSHVWRGIPYAQPPTGERRWRAPRPSFAWSGERLALDSGSYCPQLAAPFGGVDEVAPGTPAGDEDCLTLDVYAPRREPDQVPRGGSAFPVMVWLHGGGNTVGSGALYDGGRLAQSHDLVVVTINYRLGPLGWFRHASLRGPGTTPADRSGNYGTLDQIAALEWLRDNVAAFGGDPGNITVFGESAGGRDAFALLSSPRARGLFQRAIVQSGGTETIAPAHGESLSDAREPGHVNSSGEILARLWVADGRARDRAEALAALAPLSGDELAAFLRERSAEELLGTYLREDSEGLIDVPQLFADGLVLPEERPLERIAEGGRYNRVPVILGTNRDENRLFLFANPDFVQRILGVFPRIRNPELYFATADAMSRMWQSTGADGPAQVLDRRQPGEVFVYRFEWDEAPTVFFYADLGEMLGAAHGFEIPFVFGHWDLGRQANVLFDAANLPGREALSERMMSYWAQFAYAGDPGRGRDGELPPWQAWSPAPGADRVAILDTEAGGGIRMAAERVSPAQVIESVDADPRLGSQRERCVVFYQLAAWDRGFHPEDYPSAGARGCADFPFEAYPWNGAAPAPESAG